jgi:hypothetical protein
MSQVTHNVKDKMSDLDDRAHDMIDTVKEHASDMAGSGAPGMRNRLSLVGSRWWRAHPKPAPSSRT